MKLVRNLAKPFAVLATAAALIGFAAPANAMTFGINLAFTQLWHTFDGNYNAGTMTTYLNELQADHLTWTRAWVCPGLDGLSFDGNGNCTGISSQMISNVQNFAWQANNRGITVEFVFLAQNDITSHANLVENSGNLTALINNGLIPLGKAIQGYTAQIDLCNEGDYATGAVGWGYMRNFMSQAKSALVNNGVNRWVTMSIGYYASCTLTNVGGVGMDFYEYHMYNDQGWCPVAGNLGDGKPVELNEFGAATPSEGWNHNSYSFNQSLLNNFVTNARNAGYQNAAAWTYIDDGDYQMRGNQIMNDMSNWGLQINGGGGGGGGTISGTHSLAPACATGSRLDVPSSNFANGQTLQIWTANGSAAQSWSFGSLGNNAYSLSVDNGAYCLDSAGQTSPGNPATIWSCSGGNANQVWTAHSLSGGAYYFSVQNSGLCLDVRGAGSGNGTVVQTYTCNGYGGQSQSWTPQ